MNPSFQNRCRAHGEQADPLEGGIGREEVQALRAEQGKYSFWVITAARMSGAYLVGVRLCITDANGRTVLDRRLQAPWLLVDLPLGRYQVEATYNGEVLRRTTTIHRGDHHQAVFRFRVEGELAPVRE